MSRVGVSVLVWRVLRFAVPVSLLLALAAALAGMLAGSELAVLTGGMLGLEAAGAWLCEIAAARWADREIAAEWDRIVKQLEAAGR